MSVETLNNENDLTIFDEVDFPYKEYDELIVNLITLVHHLKEVQLNKQKDFDHYERNVSFLFSKYRDIKAAELSFFSKTYHNVKKNNRLERKKKRDGKDKSKYFVNLQKRAPEFILEMMNKNKDETVSQSQVLTALIQLIKKCLQEESGVYSVYKENGKIDNTRFNIEGKLKTFFYNVKEEAFKRGDEIMIPKQLGYPNLMAYLKYVIYKD